MESPRGNGENLIAVISPNFCVQENVRLTIVRRLLAITDGNFVIKEESGNTMFKVIDKLLSLHDRHVLLNSGGTPIVTFKKKHLSAHKRWQVFRGDSSEESELLFSVRKSTFVQFRTEMDVFLSENEDESSWDFKVVGSWFERSCQIHDKDSSVIAKMHKKHTVGSVVLGKDSFGVTIYPRVDHAFIVALVIILYEINEDKDD